MTELHPHRHWHPTRTTIVAGSMILVGFLLTNVSWWFFLLCALGTFGPGVLREFDWLHDKDEFQRRVEYRAAYHAILTVGLVTFVLVATIRSGITIEHPENLVGFILSLLWFTWFFSSLLSYWGAQKTVYRMLLVFGFVWLAFTIMSNLGSEWSGWAALLLHPLLAAPFFFLAWLSTRWPRATGLLLILISAFFFFLLFAPLLLRRGNLGLISQSTTAIFFLGPVLVSGITLLLAGKVDTSRIKRGMDSGTKTKSEDDAHMAEQ